MEAEDGICTVCGQKFSQVLLRSLPPKARLCLDCQALPGLGEQYDQAFEERDRKERGEK